MEERERVGAGAMMGTIVAIIVALAITWFFFLGGAVDSTGIVPTGSGGANFNQIMHQVQANPPDDGD